MPMKMPASPQFIPALGCVSLFLAMFFLCLMPFVFVNAMDTALSRLHLSPLFAFLAMVGIFGGSLINLPLYRIARDEDQPELLVPVAGLGYLSPRFQRLRPATVIAVNIGGCVVPAAVAVWQCVHLVTSEVDTLAVLVVIVGINVAVCYAAARPVRGVGIMMPTLLSPLVAVGSTWMLLAADSPDRAPVAFVAGVAGPLIGADVLHLKDVGRISTGMLSIGGAGTFDGIVLSGVLAALIA